MSTQPKSPVQAGQIDSSESSRHSAVQDLMNNSEDRQRTQLSRYFYNWSGPTEVGAGAPDGVPVAPPADPLDLDSPAQGDEHQVLSPTPETAWPADLSAST